MEEREVIPKVQTAANEFIIRQFGFNTGFRVNSVSKIEMDAGDTTELWMANIVAEQYSFDFLAIVDFHTYAKLFPTSNTAQLMIQLHVDRLVAQIRSDMETHKSDYPHVIGL